MKNQIQVTLEDGIPNENTTTTFIVTTEGYDIWFIINKVSEFVKKNHQYDTSMTIKVSSIHDPSMVESLTSQLGKSIIGCVPFFIGLGDAVRWNNSDVGFLVLTPNPDSQTTSVF
jgi:hypothetical protein